VLNIVLNGVKMWKIFKKPVENVTKSFEERLTNIESMIKKHNIDILDLYTDIDAMRDKVLRKIQSRRTKETEEEEELSKKTGILYQR
jgi:hypothetical protein